MSQTWLSLPRNIKDRKTKKTQIAKNAILLNHRKRLLIGKLCFMGFKFLFTLIQKGRTNNWQGCQSLPCFMFHRFSPLRHPLPETQVCEIGRRGGERGRDKASIWGNILKNEPCNVQQSQNWQTLQGLIVFSAPFRDHKGSSYYKIYATKNQQAVTFVMQYREK